MNGFKSYSLIVGLLTIVDLNPRYQWIFCKPLYSKGLRLKKPDKFSLITEVLLLVIDN